VTVTNGDPVQNENSAYALASCHACTTLAVSFQLVLVVGQTDKIMPINVAEALNLDCPECITTAIAKQIVVSLRSAPSEDLLRRLTAELQKLDAIDTSDPPAEVLAQVNAVTDAIQRELDASGLTYPKATPTPAPGETSAPTSSATPDASATPGSGASPAATPTPTPAGTATPTPTPTATPTPTPTATATPAP
jgi:putative peptide zinc metalloprotease protein